MLIGVISEFLFRLLNKNSEIITEKIVIIFMIMTPPIINLILLMITMLIMTIFTMKLNLTMGKKMLPILNKLILFTKPHDQKDS